MLQKHFLVLSFWWKVSLLFPATNNMALYKMKLLQRISPPRSLLAKCYWCHQQCHLPSLEKSATHLAELNIFQHNCFWNRFTSSSVFHNCSRRYHQASGGLWNHEALKKYLETVSQEYQSIGLLLDDCTINEPRRRDLSKRHAELSPLAVLFKDIQEANKEMQDLEALCAKLHSSEEKALLELALQENEIIDQKISDLYQKLFQILIPRDKYDECDVLLEVTSGRTTGGDICQQFTQEVFDMYQNYADYKCWTFEIVKYTPSDYGGLHHAAAHISGEHVYRHLKYEGGIHRVQRIPETGLSSRMQRIHTGTMSVIVLPQLEEINIKVDPRDLRVDTFRAKGAGGQHVNKTDSAVRIVHIPTGITVECQQERSQQVNRERAMQTLKEKLYQQAIERELSQKQSARKMQMKMGNTSSPETYSGVAVIPIKLGTRSQSERIRTYNFNQDRVTDHRISYEVRDIKELLSGKGLLDELINKLLEAAEKESLTEYLENNFKSSQGDT